MAVIMYIPSQVHKYTHGGAHYCQHLYGPLMSEKILLTLIILRKQNKKEEETEE